MRPAYPDAYADIRKKTAPEDENRPVAKGEFVELIKKLNPDQRVQLQNAIAVFKLLIKVLPKVRENFDESKETITARTQSTSNKVTQSILIALRRKEVDDKLATSIRLQLYNAYLLASEFENAVQLYSPLKIFVGERMRGIYALSAQIRSVIFKNSMLEQYFMTTPNSRAGLLKIFTNPSMTSATPNPDLLEPLYHFGNRLPIYFLLSNCTDITGGLCGNCDASTEERLRLIISGNFKGIDKGFLGRVCEFASTFS